MHTTYLQKLKAISAITKQSKLKRVSTFPIKYLVFTLAYHCLYKLFKSGIIVSTQTFFNTPFFLKLPAASDIFILGAKSHDAEIRLAKYIIKHQCHSHAFIDVGAHYGFYTCLVNTLNNNCKINSLEASPKTYRILRKNCTTPNIKALNYACSSTNKTAYFIENDLLFSEDNQLTKQKKNAQTIAVDCITIDTLVKAHNTQPSFIKIDVEGAELDVLIGAKALLKEYNPVLAVEFNQGNSQNLAVLEFLNKQHYTPYIINAAGNLQAINKPFENLDKLLQVHGSENLIFLKEKPN